jgi:arylsulfatase A-like enzyme
MTHPACCRCLFLLTVLLLAPQGATARDSNPPNILFILADDLGWMDLSVQGSTFYETPNIDRLAAAGMRFTDAYAAAPVCSPTRASILTGRYPTSVGITDYLYGKAAGKLQPAEYQEGLPLDAFHIAKSLRGGGYATWHVGKWHLGREPYYPQHQGFDVNVGGIHRGTPPNGYFAPWKIEHLDEGNDGDYLTDRLTDEAIKLIESNPGRPFFLNYWAYAPHTPIEAPQALVRKYEAKAKRLGLDQQVATSEGEFFPTEERKHRRLIRRHIQSHAVYAAMLENLDSNIGRLLEALDRTGRSANTIVIFTSDNGGFSTAGAPTTNLPLREGKGWLYEGGIRVPLIVRWPARVEPNTTCSVPVTSPDFAPTLLAAAGISPPAEANFEGMNLMPLLAGQAEQLGRDAIYWHYPHYGNQGGTPAAAIRRGEWKLIWFFEDDRLELYNLEQDLGEQNNLSQQNADLSAELHRMLKEWQRGTGAKLPTPRQGS